MAAFFIGYSFPVQIRFVALTGTIRFFAACCIKLLLLVYATYASADRPVEKVQLYLNWQHQFEFAGYYAAIEQGYYHEAGLDVELISFDQRRDITQTVLSAPGRFGIDNNHLLYSYLSGLPVVMLANIFKHSPHVLITQSHIRSPSELNQKTIMAATGEMSDVGMTTMFAQFGLSEAKHSYRVVPHSFSVDEFIRGDVDAMTAYQSNEVFELMRRGAKFNILDPNNYAGLLYSGNLFTSEAEVLRHPQRTRRFLEASLRGWAYALANSEELVQQIITVYGSQKSADALRFEAQKLKEAILADVFPIGSIQIERLRQMVQHYLDAQPHLQARPLAGILYQADRAALNRLGLTEQEIQYIEQHPVLRAHNERNWPPINFNVDGKPLGYSIDYMNTLAEHLGVRLEFVSGTDWAAFMNMLADGQLDVMLNIVQTEEREKRFLFTQPYISASSGIYVRKGTANESIRGMADLTGKSIAVPKGFFLESLLRTHYPGIILKTYPDSVGALEAVSVGDADAIIGRTGVLDYLTHQLFISNLTLTAPVDDERFISQMRLAVNKDNPLLQSILNKVMTHLAEDELLQLQRKWGQSLPSETLRLTTQEQHYLDTRGRIRVCVDPAWMPFEALNSQGEHIGMVADYFDRFSQFLNTQFDIVKSTNWEETMDFAKARRCDLVSLLQKNAERSEFLSFTAPYFSMPLVIATRKESLFIEDLGQLQGKKLGFVAGYSYSKELQEKFPSIDWQLVSNVADGLLKVQAGELFGFVDMVPSIGYAIRDAGLSDVRITGRLPEERQLSVGIRNDDPILLGIMEKAVAQLTDEQHQKIRSQWTAVEYVSGINRRFVLWISAVAVMVIGLLVYRQLLLRRYNRRIQQAYQEKEQAHAQLLEKTAELLRISTTDALTGVSNRMKMTQLLEQELARAARYGGYFSVIMVDLDHFKEVNDRFGHAVGDDTLIACTQVLKKGLRNTDTLARWGGEEFLILCPGIDLAGAVTCAEHLRTALEAHNFSPVARQLASFGVTAYRSGDAVAELLNRADKALYQSKTQGRNRVTQLA